MKSIIAIKARWSGKMKTATVANYIKSYNMKELAALYGETPKTIRAWLKPHQARVGLRLGKKYTPRQVCIIFDILGLPSSVPDERS